VDFHKPLLKQFPVQLFICNIIGFSLIAFVIAVS